MTERQTEVGGGGRGERKFERGQGGRGVEGV